MKIRIVSDGTGRGTHIYDAESGIEIGRGMRCAGMTFDATDGATASLEGIAEQVNSDVLANLHSISIVGSLGLIESEEWELRILTECLRESAQDTLTALHRMGYRLIRPRLGKE